jgi:hypothetical protein
VQPPTRKPRFWLRLLGDYDRMDNGELQFLSTKFRIPDIARSGPEGADWSYGREGVIAALRARDSAVLNRIFSVISLIISVVALCVSIFKR